LRVKLIEAGGAPKNRFVGIPTGFSKLFKSEVDWAFKSEPQGTVGGRGIFTPRGEMLGGSSNMNAQMHQWCPPADYVGWLEPGASGWGWNEVAPVFGAMERWGGDDAAGSVRGHDGPMPRERRLRGRRPGSRTRPSVDGGDRQLACISKQSQTDFALSPAYAPTGRWALRLRLDRSLNRSRSPP
jgi:choline dehydrogenase-like flavoprotein